MNAGQAVAGVEVPGWGETVYVSVQHDIGGSGTILDISGWK